MLKVSPWKGVMRFGKKGKLSPRYIGPFEILKKMGPLAYQLALPPDLQHIHDVFHVPVVREYHSDFRHVITYEPVEIRPNLTYEEQPVQILDHKVQELRTKKVSLVKVLWRNHQVEEATWELESEMQNKHPELLSA